MRALIWVQMPQGFSLFISRAITSFGKIMLDWAARVFFWQVWPPLESMLDVITIYLKRMMPPIVPITPLKAYLARAIFIRETRPVIPIMVSGWGFQATAR